MAKYHVSPATGNPGICRAIYACPFGGDEDHYSSAGEARDAYEASMAEELLSSSAQKSGATFFDGEVSDDMRDWIVGGRFEYEGIVLERDWSTYDATVWRGGEANLGALGSLELWHNERIGLVTGYAMVNGEEEVMFAEPYEGELTEDGQALAFAQLVEKAKEHDPAVYDRAHSLYALRHEMQAMVEDGRVEIAGIEFQDEYGTAPEIWQAQGVLPHGAQDAYVRNRHGRATLTLIDSEDVPHEIHSEAGDNWDRYSKEGAASKALFFMKANDYLLKWEAEEEAYNAS